MIVNKFNIGDKVIITLNDTSEFSGISRRLATITGLVCGDVYSIRYAIMGLNGYAHASEITLLSAAGGKDNTTNTESMVGETATTAPIPPPSVFKFTHDTLMAFMQGLSTMADEEAMKKNMDYAATGDGKTGLSNFYETAIRVGITPMQVLSVHMLKHDFAIEKMMRGEELKSEPIVGRIIDKINYLKLALALYIERTQDVDTLKEIVGEVSGKREGREG